MKARNLISLLIALAAGIVLAGCDHTVGGTVSSVTSTPPPEATPADANFKPADPAAKAAMDEKKAKEEDAAATATPSSSDGSAKAGDKVAVIDTNMGRIVFTFLTDKAPKTVKNFQDLANKHFYDGVKFHRVIPKFMIQGGDPNTKGGDRTQYGQGGPGYAIDDEFSNVSHKRGIVSMAHTSAPNSGGSQFFICVGDPTFLDGKYSAFGHVVQGMNVADKIVAVDRDASDDPLPPHEVVMKTVRIETWPLKG